MSAGAKTGAALVSLVCFLPAVMYFCNRFFTAPEQLAAVRIFFAAIVALAACGGVLYLFCSSVKQWQFLILFVLAAFGVSVYAVWHLADYNAAFIWTTPFAILAVPFVLAMPKNPFWKSVPEKLAVIGSIAGLCILFFRILQMTVPGADVFSTTYPAVVLLGIFIAVYLVSFFLLGAAVLFICVFGPVRLRESHKIFAWTWNHPAFVLISMPFFLMIPVQFVRLAGGTEFPDQLLTAGLYLLGFFGVLWYLSSEKPAKWWYALPYAVCTIGIAVAGIFCGAGNLLLFFPFGWIVLPVLLLRQDTEEFDGISFGTVLFAAAVTTLPYLYFVFASFSGAGEISVIHRNYLGTLMFLVMIMQALIGILIASGAGEKKKDSF